MPNFVPSSAGASKSTGDKSSPQIRWYLRKGTDPPSSCSLTRCHLKWQHFSTLPLRKRKNCGWTTWQPTCLLRRQWRWWCQQQQQRRWWWSEVEKGLDVEVVEIVAAQWCHKHVSVTYLEYFGTYLGYLSTNHISQHSDTFPANPTLNPRHSTSSLTAELVLFLLRNS